MTTNIEHILKKTQITGEEIGRLMIKDLIVQYENILQGKDGELLADNEKDILVDKLNTREDIMIYNEFKYIHDFVVSIPIRYELSKAVLERDFWKLYYLLRAVENSEYYERQFLHRMPHIVTQSQYDRMKEEHIKCVTQDHCYSMEMLFFSALTDALYKYSHRKKTPFKHLIDATKKQSIKNKRLKTNYWIAKTKGYYKYSDGTTSKDKKNKKFCKDDIEQQIYNCFSIGNENTIEDIIKSLEKQKENDRLKAMYESGEWIADDIVSENDNMFDVLKSAREFYYTLETEGQYSFLDMKTDFPEIYDAIIDFLKNYEGLSFLAQIPESKYLEYKIPVEKLLHVDFLGIDETLSIFNPSNNNNYFGGGVAILQDTGITTPTHNIDKNGDFITYHSLHFEQNKAEVLLGDKSNYIRELIHNIKRCYSELYSYSTFLAITGDFIKVKGLSILITPVQEGMAYILNDIFNRLPRNLCYIEGRDINALAKQLRDLLQPIVISDLQPEASTVKQLKKTISYNTFHGHAQNAINELQKVVC